MLPSFLFSLLAGYLAALARDPFGPVLRRLEAAAKVDLGLDAAERRVLTFGLMLILAAVATALAGSNSSAFLAVSGGLLGFFGRELYAFCRDPNKAMGQDDDNWDGGVSEAGGRRSVGDHRQPAEEATAVDTASARPPGADDDAEATLRAVSDAMQKGAASEAEPATDLKDKEGDS